LCPPCSYARRTDLLVQEAVDLAVAARADLGDAEQVAQFTARCQADTRTLIADVCRLRVGDEAWAAYVAQEVAERVRDERRVAVMRRLLAALRQRPRDDRGAEAAARFAAFAQDRPQPAAARHSTASRSNSARGVRRTNVL
jgi:hypothetical protein